MAHVDSTRSEKDSRGKREKNGGAELTPPAIAAERLSKRFGELVALDGVSFEVPRGQILALLGANGAGKSTTVHLLLGLLAASSGSAAIDGRDVRTDLEGARRAAAYVPDRLSLYPHLSGLENLEYFHRATGHGALGTSELLDVLQRVGLGAAEAHRRTGTYSKGMCQKVGLAIALAKGARALLLDEPLSGLDPKAANEFCAVLRDFAAKGIAVLMATHDLFRAHDLAHDIGIMRGGRLVSKLRARDVAADRLEAIYLEQMQ
ncbi:ABC transporter ATP-binding protein [Pendulispora albinea]|uniref:ABC transporter ATP-binding protein n=1 Tax=Pendulispora albinea TaxID=2741071 RepID=A0ABZ2LYH6_9BACT